MFARSMVGFLIIISIFNYSCNKAIQSNKENLRIDSTQSKGLNIKFTDSPTSPYGPTSITRNIKQDKNGNLWLATWEGIIHYDGRTFTNITKQKGLELARAFAVHEDNKGHIWFATIGGGVLNFDGETFTKFTTNEGLGSNRVTYICEDKSDNLWFGTEGGLSLYDGESITNFTTENGLPHNSVNSIIEDQNGIYWIGTSGSACFYDGENFNLIKTSKDKTFENVRSIIEDKKGNIWLGGNDGLWQYDGNIFTNRSTYFVGYIYEDPEGNIWTSSESDEGGNWILTRYNEDGTKAILKPEAIMTFGITEDNKGNIWFGMLDGVGQYDGGSFNYFRDPNANK